MHTLPAAAQRAAPRVVDSAVGAYDPLLVALDKHLLNVNVMMEERLMEERLMEI